jgi:hypothetical protein
MLRQHIDIAIKPAIQRDVLTLKFGISMSGAAKNRVPGDDAAIAENLGARLDDNRAPRRLQAFMNDRGNLDAPAGGTQFTADFAFNRDLTASGIKVAADPGGDVDISGRNLDLAIDLAAHFQIAAEKFDIAMDSGVNPAIAGYGGYIAVNDPANIEIATEKTDIIPAAVDIDLTADYLGVGAHGNCEKSQPRGHYLFEIIHHESPSAPRRSGGWLTGTALSDRAIQESSNT